MKLLTNAMTESLINKVALVTGSSRGIGRAIAMAMARAGADVVVHCLERESAAEAVVTEIRRMGRRSTHVKGNVAKRDDVRRILESAVKTLGGLDILVNNAGVLQQKPWLAITDEDIDRVLAANLKGVLLCCQEAWPFLQQRQGAAIINMASSGGQLGGPLAVHYSASKAGVICLTKSLARLGAPSIRVNCISPGLIATEMTKDEMASEVGRQKLQQLPLQRAGTADEVAAVALFLASDAAAYITGQTINVNGGLYLG